MTGGRWRSVLWCAGRPYWNMGVKERARAKKRKAAVSAKRLEQQARLDKRRGAHGKAMEQVLPFGKEHRVLLVGEGDFSFSCAMAQLLGQVLLRRCFLQTAWAKMPTDHRCCSRNVRLFR